MAKNLNFTDAEHDLIETALERELDSAKRSQNTSKQPEFKELYKKREGALQALIGKIKA